MTEKLYYQDSYLYEFDARVLGCEAGPAGYLVTLDRTAFYPEGGGQPTDKGTLGGAGVSMVKEKDSVIYHTCDKALEVGATVHGSVDAARRRDLMEQHSGEHIVSGLICRHFSCSNVGFHISEDFVVIDFNTEADMEQLLAIEDEANRIIRENKPAHIFLPTPEELGALEYRSKKELSGQVRIVEFYDADICACCGTHVGRTGEIGLVKIVSVQNHRGGIRIEMLCGGRALKYVQTICRENHAVSVTLSAAETTTAAAAAAMKEEMGRLLGRIGELVRAEHARRAEDLRGKGAVLLIEKGLSSDELRNLAIAVMDTCGGLCAALSEDGTGHVRYVIGEVGGNLQTLCKALNGRLNGRGGGKPEFVQGSFECSAETAAEALRELAPALRS